jgi:hypothetical protein
METTSESSPSMSNIDSAPQAQTFLQASRERKRQYVQNLEKAIHILTTEKLELQVKVATLTNQLWEQSLQIDQLASHH